LHNKAISLFTEYNIEQQVQNAFKREISLPSRGSIIIDNTEALTAIDVNSARATQGDNIEETALLINLEAAIETAKQLRLRDLGGLIIVDFIDMASLDNQKIVEEALINEFMVDRAKIQMTRVSKFGLVEISRQRMQASLSDSLMYNCPRCKGYGLIRSIPSLALSILNTVRSEARYDKTNEIRVELPVDVATFLLNEKREEIKEIEESCKVKILLIPSPNLYSPNFLVQRIWGECYYTNKTDAALTEEIKSRLIYKSFKYEDPQATVLDIIDTQYSKRKVLSWTVNNLTNLLKKLTCHFLDNKKEKQVTKKKRLLRPTYDNYCTVQHSVTDAKCENKEILTLPKAKKLPTS
jgi:ribonuclease E